MSVKREVSYSDSNRLLFVGFALRSVFLITFSSGDAKHIATFNCDWVVSFDNSSCFELVNPSERAHSCSLLETWFPLLWT